MSRKNSNPMSFQNHVILIALVLFVITSVTNAQSDQRLITVPKICPTLTKYQALGSSDVRTNGETTKLQIFLKNYLGLTDSQYIVTGYFGRITSKFVKEFQSRNSLIATGQIGQPSRAKIAQVCQVGTSSNFILPDTNTNKICPAIGTPVCIDGILNEEIVNGCSVKKCSKLPNQDQSQVTCISLSPEFRTLGCAAGQLGEIIEERISICNSGAATPVWGSWHVYKNSCTNKTENVTYNWDISTWANCTGGTQTRTVNCKSSNGESVSDTFCTGAKPPSTQSCGTLGTTTSSLTYYNYSSYDGYKGCLAINSTETMKSKSYIYKTVYNTTLKRNIQLRAHVFYPPGYSPTNGIKYPTVALFHGGGWRVGNPVFYVPLAQYLASRGAIAVTFQYRLISWTPDYSLTPEDSAKDGISAIRWLKKNATSLSVDTNKIAVLGDSAGGHVALAATTLYKGISDEISPDNSISTGVAGTVLLYPLTDAEIPSSTGFVWFNAKNFSPKYQLSNYSSSELSPVHILQGTGDTFFMTSYAASSSKIFCDLYNSKKPGSCTINYYKGEEHGFLPDLVKTGSTPKAYADIDSYLAGLGITSTQSANKYLELANSSASTCRIDQVYDYTVNVLPGYYGYTNGIGTSPVTDAW